VAEDVTGLLLAWSGGDRGALERLLPLVYGELRRRAHARLRRESPGHALETTDLVHEVYLRLVDQERARWQNRAHFFAIAARLMRRILVDHARSRRALKRGAGQAPVSLDLAPTLAAAPQMDYVALDEALQRLQALDERQGTVVELRFFAGLSVEETAHVLSLSPATVKREWATAKAWLFREMGGGAPPA
jgi:RNA polymerase sigma factor (TIGR02999 family)